MAFSELPYAPLQPLDLPWLAHAGIQAAILRLDLIDPLISGNKWFKLRHHLLAARASGAPGLISLGGNHSNHLHALAAAGQRFGFATAGLLRGHAQDTPTVTDLQRWGMALHWLGYGGYRTRHEPDFWASWQARYPGWYCIPEGGGGAAGALGCQAIVEQARAQLPALGWEDFDAWWLAVGTGTTLAGLVQGEQGAHEVHGALAVPAHPDLIEHIQALAGSAGYQLHEACRGGFARIDDSLRRFIENTECQTQVPLEALYSGKLLMALHDQVQAGQIAPGSRLIVVHGGGLQGRRGYL
ncbi:pyridoxal-phosphate dependent enzyme [Pseudomonas sp. RP23018S]|uniref:1-aminocyclopropane-1-carboxylate deaminase/D-cysteine desulfhydrase n=1 Tax=Pseudomonas sp. RP23018S TaxID=3096037 RepID=UPI002ACAC235|nr:pyridoxal-phosphate dependent enzyme [Pseudomonas sp. RP23018S]MDZ5602231.1 pyridoxal-phosphate dependent enzyme [Pseudomonas sp. RP23018S]